MMERVIEGRVATQADVDSGVCVFFIPEERSAVYLLGYPLPIPAKIIRPNDGSDFPAFGTRVQIVQAEIIDNSEILVGFLTDEFEGVCALEDIELLSVLEAR